MSKEKLSKPEKDRARIRLAVDAAENHFRSLGYKCEFDTTIHNEESADDGLYYYKHESPTGQLAFGAQTSKMIFCCINC